MRFCFPPLIFLFIALAGLGRVPRATAQESFGATTLSLDPAIMTMGTSVTGQDGRSWAYVVWKSPRAATLAGRSFAIYLQSTSGGPFVKQGVVAPAADPAALNLLLGRASNLGTDNEELNEDLAVLLSRPSWANGTSFNNKSVLIKLSACMNRALTNGNASNALGVIAPVHPALRMAMGQAWAGALPAGGMPMTIEVREHSASSGLDGTVIGRVTVTPGQGITLAAPGQITQVPDLQPGANRLVKLRWATPDTLRRQQLQVLGFRVYRVSTFDANARGLDETSSRAEVAAALAGPTPLPTFEVNEAPVPISKLFTDDSVDNFSSAPEPPLFLPGDSSTFFAVDNFKDLDPEVFAYSHFAYYFVRAFDLLGRPGPPSVLCAARAEVTIPPDVPSGLVAKDLPVGAGGARRIQLRWRANATATDGRTTTRYAVYRDNVNISSLTTLEIPAQFRFNEPVGYVQTFEADSQGYLTFVDDSLTTDDLGTDHSLWYAVTALHATPLDHLVSSVHDLVQSAPSPPAFGIFRDRAGPNAPTGGLGINTQKLVTLPAAPVSKDSSPRPPPHLNNVDLLHLRFIVRRRDTSVEGVRFVVAQRRVPFQFFTTEFVAFPPGQDEVVVEQDLLRSFSSEAGLNIACDARTPDGCVALAYPVEYEPEDVPESSESLYHNSYFTLGKFAATEFVPNSGSPVAHLGTAVPLNSVVVKGQGVLQVIMQEALNGQTVVAQTRIGSLNPWKDLGVAQVGLLESTNVFTLAHAARSLTEGSNPFQYRVFKLPAGGDCTPLHQPRPPGVDQIVPVDVWMNLPATTREWRIYRRVDDGPLALVKSGIQDLANMAEKAVAEDHAMPPNGGVLSYYAQCFDQNNNPSPLKFLQKVSLFPNPAKPVLSVPEYLPMEGAGTRKIRLRWFSPPAGVKNFRICVLPVEYHQTEAEGVAPLVKIGAGDEPSGNLYSVKYTLAGETEPRSVKMGYFFHTPDLPRNTTEAMHTCEVIVDPEVAYVAWVQTMGKGDGQYPTSLAQPLQWKTPGAQVDAATSEPLVPWPTRPLPPVQTLTIAGVGGAFLMKDAVSTPGFLYDRSSLFDEGTGTMPNLYPVGIRIGLMPFLPEPRGELIQIVPDILAAGYPVKFIPSPGLSFDPASYVLPGLLSCALYRQTILEDGSPGALVQVSPLREGIAWKQESVTYTPPGGGTADAPGSVMRDPFIKVLTYNVANVPLAFLTLVDTHSVEEGATYHYYLASYSKGELATVWDCGTVTIPESP